MLTLLALAVLAQDPQPKSERELRAAKDVPETMTQEQALASLERSLAFITSSQNPDGSWCGSAPDSVMELGFNPETYYTWQLGAVELTLMSLMQCDETPERRRALERGMEWLCTTRLPARGSDWDVDYMWPSLYGVVCALDALDDPRFAAQEWQRKIDARGRAFMEILERSQVPDGGWGYYDDPPFTNRPKWATSFATATVVPALADAQKRGWFADPKVRERAVAYIAGCALPNGAYEYDLNPIPRAGVGESINSVKGSLGRIQICNWALRRCGIKFVTDEKIREGLGFFMEHHRFLDVARMRPVPHEAYYANAGYFYFFGHYYAALAINELPATEREAWHAKLRPHLVKCQYDDGSTSDFLHSRYDILASTAYAAMALDLGLPDARTDAR
ncbi:MAG: terpene cyclase/mutase family protein [Planctomycetes bacterium]|nr:terpene cyclase/mutase family protein [Planctomycetota bacterium]